MDDLIVLLKVLDLLHDLFENFGAVLWRIAVFYKADLDLQLQLIADVLIVQPVSKRRFGIDDLFDLLRQSLALVVDDNTVNLFIGSVSISCFLFDRNLLCVAAPRIIRTTVELAILSPAANQKSTALWAYFLLCQNCNIPNHMGRSRFCKKIMSLTTSVPALARKALLGRRMAPSKSARSAMCLRAVLSLLSMV